LLCPRRGEPARRHEPQQGLSLALGDSLAFSFVVDLLDEGLLVLARGLIASRRCLAASDASLTIIVVMRNRSASATCGLAMASRTRAKPTSLHLLLEQSARAAAKGPAQSASTSAASSGPTASAIPPAIAALAASSARTKLVEAARLLIQVA
jgi:hypothetical protein